MLGDKHRLRFRKSGDLRLLSHLDLTRCVERMLRRADLPFKSTGGFHPTPRMIFALSLPLGVTAANEVLELELLQPFEAAEVQARLNQTAPVGLVFHTADVVQMKASAVPRRVIYTLALPQNRVQSTQLAIEKLLAQDKVWVERIKPRPRRVNIKPYLRSIRIDQSQSIELILDLWVTQNGTARADELVLALGLQDLVDSGILIDRRELELHDETPPGQPDAPPDGPPELAPWNHAPVDTGADEPHHEQSVAMVAAWGLTEGGGVGIVPSPLGPVVE